MSGCSTSSTRSARRSPTLDPDEVASIVVEAASARNGWKVILARCAPARRAGGIGTGAEKPSEEAVAGSMGENL
jgi:hypothetical protein